MSSTTSFSLRQRVGLAVGAGTLALLGGAGIGYAATASNAPVETGWATVASGDDGRGAAVSTADRSEARTSADCPDDEGAGGSGGTAADDEAPQTAAPSQDGDL